VGTHANEPKTVALVTWAPRPETIDQCKNGVSRFHTKKNSGSVLIATSYGDATLT
jgi:hypothetical protein